MDLERGAAPDAEGGGGAGGRDSGLAAMVEGSEPSDGLSSDEAGSAAWSRIESGTELISHRVGGQRTQSERSHTNRAFQ